MGDSTTEVSPEEAGISIDYAASAAEAGARKSWNPAWLWDYATGGDEVPPVVDVDEDALAAYLSELGDQVRTEPVEGAIRFKPKGIRVTDPVVGNELDTDGAREALVAAYLDEDDATAELPLAEAAPDIDADDIERARTEFAEPAMSGPVTFRFGDAEVSLKPRQFMRALRLVPEDGELVPAAAAQGAGPAALRPGVGRRCRSGGRRDQAAGRQAAGDPGQARRQLRPGRGRRGVPRPRRPPAGERAMEVPAEVVEPAFTTADAKALAHQGGGLGVHDVLPLRRVPQHQHRPRRRAGRRDDRGAGRDVLAQRHVGERTAENGFTNGFIISNGIFKEDLGGGVSQMATTTFNAAFFAGMTDVEHKTHSFYIDRYPVGREATVAWPTVDLSAATTRRTACSSTPTSRRAPPRRRAW